MAFESEAPGILYVCRAFSRSFVSGTYWNATLLWVAKFVMNFCFHDLMPSKGGILSWSECFIFTFVVGVTPHFLSKKVNSTILLEKLAILNLCETSVVRFHNQARIDCFNSACFLLSLLYNSRRSVKKSSCSPGEIVLRTWRCFWYSIRQDWLFYTQLNRGCFMGDLEKYLYLIYYAQGPAF